MTVTWDHAICDGCWIRREPSKEPVRLLEPESEQCCFCGSLTHSGIYVREHPTSERLDCGGEHP